MANCVLAINVVRMENRQRHVLPAAFGLEVALDALEHLRRLYSAKHSEGSSRSAKPWSNLGKVQVNKRRESSRLEQLLASHQLRDALVVAAALKNSWPEDERFLVAAREVFRRTGSITWETETVAMLRELSDSNQLRQRESFLQGQLRETDPEWLPTFESDIDLGSEADDSQVLHLLKISLPYRQSGYSVRSNYLIAGQRAQGLEPSAITALGFPQNIGIDDPPDVDEVDSTSFYRLKHPDPKISSRPFDYYLEEYVSEAAPLVASLQPSIIHAHSGHRGYETALVGMALARSFKIPLVYEVRGFFESLWSRDPDWNERGELYWRRLYAENRCMNAAQAVVTLSETMREEILSRGVPGNRVFVVPNGVDPDQFYPAPRNEALTRRLGLEDTFVFGYVSNLDHYREGQELLIQAASHLIKRGISVKALIIGDGSRRDELEALATQKGVSRHVVFTGQIPHDQVLSYYRLLDVFVVPRIPERAARLVSPLKPYEAMAAGVPLVVSDLPALSELVAQGRGVTFRAGDAHALAEALAKLCTDDAFRETSAQAARNWVLAERRWSHLAGRYEDVYKFARENRKCQDSQASVTQVDEPPRVSERF